MIALGGTIGTGLFVGSGQTLARGGPAFILGTFIFMAALIWMIVTAITEMSAYLPTRGSSMTMFSDRFVSSSFSFALGWLYWYSLGILVPYEITAAGLVIEYWGSTINIAVWISIMLVLIVALNLLPVKFYGEVEFWFAGTKVIMMIGLLILSFVLFWGGGPSHDRLGFRYWQNPGAANVYLAGGNTGRFIALLSTWVLSAFPFAFAPELLVATGGEIEDPRRNLPIAARRYFYRLIFFYIFSVLAIGVICRSDDSQLTNGGVGAGSSAFVIGIKNAGIPILDSIINGGIILSAWSSGNSFLYLSGRSLYTLALAGNAPAWFKHCSKNGVPYRAMGLNVANSASVVFNWLVNLTNTSAFISWICCCVTYIRFRKAIAAQNIPESELPYRNNIMQPWGAWFAMIFFTILTLINGFTVFWPQNWSIASFFTAYVGIPIPIIIFVVHKVFWARNEPWARPPMTVDLVSGLDEVLLQDKPKKPYTKWYHYIKVLWE
ncbi:histidine permease [Aureobasidium pullulans]|uniref:Histidine permease n=1 Tax=Aureobasidium pullulans TaxID=5580 RepID=A0A4S9Z7R0_AURPU|nr:histidine permease [Aureobasidium pullulans]THW58152.1 histidine permease [Aureobasidium pullulans]TIA01268.1 histidine permease [Aureobasidium pullulans]